MRTRTRKPHRRSTPQAPKQRAKPEPARGLIDLQQRAGNAAVAGLVAREPAATKPKADPARLYGWEAKDEADDLNRARRLEGPSIRAVQAALGTPATGTFSAVDAQALSHLRVKHGFGRGGFLDRDTLNALLRELPAGMENEIIHVVADYARIDLSRDTLSVRFDDSLTDPSGVMFEDATLRRILVGKPALKGYGKLVAAIEKQLEPDPPLASATRGPTPSLLSDADAGDAALANATKLRDRRSALAIQGALRSPATGEFDAATSQFIADRQATMGLTKRDGVVDDDFLHHIVKTLNGGGDRDALIRLVVDYARIDESIVIDAGFDASLDPTRDFVISSAAPGAPMTLKLGPAAFAGQTPETIVTTIVNAFEQAKLQAAASP